MKTMRVLSVLNLGDGKRSFDSGIAFPVIDRGKSEARLPSSRDHGHPENLGGEVRPGSDNR